MNVLTCRGARIEPAEPPVLPCIDGTPLDVIGIKNGADLDFTIKNYNANSLENAKVVRLPMYIYTALRHEYEARNGPIKDSAPDRSKQVGGNHYAKHAIQPWDIIDEYGLDYYEGNALKYLLREKDPAKREEDLRKAIHYLEAVIARIKS